MEPWQQIDQAGFAEARRLLTSCCGATCWVERMLGRRPFGNREALIAAAREIWFLLSEEDWREAFTHHPKIGERNLSDGRFADTSELSKKEQAGVADATSAIRDALMRANRAYEDRFGYIFIVCATGKTAEEMLSLLRERIGNPPDVEIRVAAEEQAKITARRLDAL